MVKATQAKAPPKEERKEVPCMVCGKKTLGWGTFRTGVVCGKACNETYMRQRYEQPA